MKRFTETEKWRDPWFRSLPAPAKLVFFYFVDNCNNAGFHELDQDLMVMLTGMKPEHCEGALKALGRGIIGPCEGWYWVRRFLRHQKNEPLNEANPAHKQIIVLVRDQLSRFKDSTEFQDFVAPYKGLLSPIGIGTGTGTGTGKGKERGVQRGKASKPESAEEITAFCSEIGLPATDAAWLWDHWMGNGFTNRGHPMRDWHATIRSWRSASGILPSQKSQSNGATPWQSAKEQKQAEIDAANRAYRERKRKQAT